MMSAFEAAASRAYADGRREQRCPSCGREEAAGARCTAGPLSRPPCHYRPTHPAEWIAKPLSDAQRAARTGPGPSLVSVAARKVARPPHQPHQPLTLAL